MWGVFSNFGKQEVKILSSPTQIWTPRPPNYIYTAVKKYLRLPDFSVLGFVFLGGWVEGAGLCIFVTLHHQKKPNQTKMQFQMMI